MLFISSKENHQKERKFNIPSEVTVADNIWKRNTKNKLTKWKIGYKLSYIKLPCDLITVTRAGPSPAMPCLMSFSFVQPLRPANSEQRAISCRAMISAFMDQQSGPGASNHWHCLVYLPVYEQSLIFMFRVGWFPIRRQRGRIRARSEKKRGSRSRDFSFNSFSVILF